MYYFSTFALIKRLSDISKIQIWLSHPLLNILHCFSFPSDKFFFFFNLWLHPSLTSLSIQSIWLETLSPRSLTQSLWTALEALARDHSKIQHIFFRTELIKLHRICLCNHTIATNLGHEVKEYICLFISGPPESSTEYIFNSIWAAE